MKKLMPYIFGIIAVAIGTAFYTVFAPSALDMLAHIADSSYQQPTSTDTATRIFAILTGIIGCLANIVLPSSSDHDDQKSDS